MSTLLAMAAEDDRIMFITGDLGWSVVEKFARRFPKRFINAGVAEADAVGIATGLALEGFVPFVYSIATFSSMRPYEQIRNGPILHRLPVRIIGIGGGFSYSHAGPTHFALEDLAIMRTQPGMTVIAPADPAQTKSALLATAEILGPVYLRVGNGGNPEVPGLEGKFALGRPETVREGKDVLFLATGGSAVAALDAAKVLERENKAAAVAVLAHLGFSAGPELVALLSRYRAVVTAEEGFVVGGLGSLVAETVAGRGLNCRVVSAGVRTTFGSVTGSRAWLDRKHNIDADSLARAAREAMTGAASGR
jgi:transketolase